MKVDVAPYRLTPRSALGHGGRAAREGFLLRVEAPSGALGYADCHSWPELGEAPAPAQRLALRQGQPTPLVRRAMVLALADAAARTSGVGLLAGRRLPPSHVLVPDSLPELGELLVSTGATSVKYKMGHDLGAVATALADIHAEFPAIRLRLDANGRHVADDIASFWSRLSASLRAAIDFVEDPLPPPVSRWSQLLPPDLPAAWDRGSEKWVRGLSSIRVLVHKPAWGPTQELVRRTLGTEVALVITTALGHPLGSLAAAWEAARAAESGGTVLACGLLSHLAYEMDAFSEQLSISHGVLIGPAGPGFGFGELLEAQQWEAP